MLAALTGLGLSSAAGLNAYIPILVVGLLARFTDKVVLPHDLAWMSNGWALSVVGVLLAVEVVLDKVAVVDHINDMIQTFVRPTAGGAVFAATNAAAQVDSSSWMAEHPWVSWVLGIVVAFVVHAVKTTARPVVNASTVGVGTPFVSAAEDAFSLVMSVVAILLPVLALVMLVLFGWAGYRMVRAIRRRRKKRATAEPGAPPAEQRS